MLGLDDGITVTSFPNDVATCQNAPMRFRSGAILGFAIGYYLGIKADNATRERVLHAAERISSDARVQTALDATKQQRSTLLSIVREALRRTSTTIRSVEDSDTARN